MKGLRKLLQEESGQGTSEYALLFAGIAVAAIIVSVMFIDGLDALFGSLLDALAGSPPPS